MITRKILAASIIIALSVIFYGALWAELPPDDPPDNFRDFIKAGKLEGQFRTYYMKRHFDTPRTQESMAMGGSLGYATYPWHGLSAGLAASTSQGVIFTNHKNDGAGLLAPGQDGYTVLSQAYFQAEKGRNNLRLFRQMLETPFINSFDVKITPITVEAYTLESKLITNFDLLVSHVTKIKGWNKTKFINMSEAAGFSGTDDPVTLLGLVFTPKEGYSLQLWEYYCHEFMNVIYLQADANWKLNEGLSLSGSIQAFDQQDTGKALDGEFHTGMLGVQTGVDWQGANFKLGYTITDKDHDIVNPWGAYPGYTSIMEEDCDLAGEKSWVFGIAYDFARIGLKGLTAFINHTRSSMPSSSTFFASDQYETDFTADYSFSGKLEGFKLRLRAAFVDNSKDMGGADYSDYRVIINYDF
ncbi:MAG: OprD family outer membrane porin [Candidatus Omnitrophota bacterium]